MLFDEKETKGTGPKGGPTTGAAPEEPGERGKPPAQLPALTELKPGWNRLEPGGDTLCAKGTPYAFFVRPGTVDNVVIDFRGGGACWDSETCRKHNIYERTVPNDPFLTDESKAEGILDHQNPENPFKDWTHVFVSYCTGDIHWGDNDWHDRRQTGWQEKPDLGQYVHFRGAVNTRAVLEWVYENFAMPGKVFVTGCSAGAYGAILWSAHVKQHYAGAQVYELGDSGVGIMTERFFKESFPRWGATKAFPTWIPGLDPANIKSLNELYEAIGRFHASMPLAQRSTKFDREQVYRYHLMGGGAAEEWSAKMQASFKAIEANTPNFQYILAPGDEHCILPTNELYSEAVCGKKVVEWVADRVNDRSTRSLNADECPMMP